MHADLAGPPTTSKRESSAAAPNLGLNELKSKAQVGQKSPPQFRKPSHLRAKTRDPQYSTDASRGPPARLPGWARSAVPQSGSPASWPVPKQAISRLRRSAAPRASRPEPQLGQMAAASVPTTLPQMGPAGGALRPAPLAISRPAVNGADSRVRPARARKAGTRWSRSGFGARLPSVPSPFLGMRR
ncbi:PREDICTED: uncharacterized protein LOC102003334 isoform X2 [Chinchilla lanigera]|nr:PREDICTED: uncharacterized protein LOC102003334 isoform X2 [Chinchilla lanigera]